MTKQKGQSAVEFAFIVPFVIFMFLGLIYGGILFMDYIQYNNAARAIARSAAFKEDGFYNANGTIKDETRASLQKQYFNPLTTLYTATLTTVTKSKADSTVTVQIDFVRAENLGVFEWLGFPPQTLKAVVYTMPIETVATDTETSSTEETEGGTT